MEKRLRRAFRWGMTRHNLCDLMVQLFKNIRLHSTLRTLLATLRYLQSDKGCEWDRAQHPHSLRAHLIEESKELVEAIEENDRTHIVEECGDVLLVLLLMVNSKKGNHTLSLTEVCAALNKKLLRRHPHVFGSRTVKRRIAQAEANENHWERAKKAERSSSKDTK